MERYDRGEHPQISFERETRDISTAQATKRGERGSDTDREPPTYSHVSARRRSQRRTGNYWGAAYSYRRRRVGGFADTPQEGVGAWENGLISNPYG